MKNKIITMLLAILMAISLAFALASCVTTVKAVEIELDVSKIAQEVVVGDSIDLSAVKATVKYDDNTETALTAEELDFYIGDEKIENLVVEGKTDEVGEIEFSVKYLKLVETFKVVVRDKTATSIALDLSDFTATVKVGEDIDLTTVKATVTFEDESTSDLAYSGITFYYGEQKLTDAILATLTAEEGTVTVKAVYREVYAEIEITVIPLTLDDLYYITDFAMPANETARLSKATNTSDEDEGKFFASEDTVRLVGDDNAFVFVPSISAYYQEDDMPVANFTCATIATIKTGDTLLTAKNENEETKTIEYYNNDELIVVMNYSTGKYDFTDLAIGNVYEISVLPKDMDYEDDPVVITVKVVDGYNVYDAKDLGIIDNTRTKSWSRMNDWAAIREEKGWTIEMIDATNAIVFQRDIKVTYADLPSEYVGEIAREMTYYNFGDYENPVETGISNYRLMHDDDKQMSIYERNTAKDFAIYGNFYTLNLSEFPLASAFDEIAKEKDELGKNRQISKYGADFSNATLIRMHNGEEKSGARVKLNISNIDVIGNANIEQYQVFAANDTDKTNPLPVNAGGLLLLKAGYNCDAEIENSIFKTIFIVFLPEYGGSVTTDYIKVYDCYQNVGFVWDDSVMTVTNSVMKRAGGPLFIMQHVDPDKNATSRMPELYITDTILENFVTGEELWFATMGDAAAEVGKIKTAVNMFANAFGKTVTKNSGSKENCLNLICLSMSNGVDTDALEKPDAQGYCTLTQDDRTYVMDRMNSNVFGGTLKYVLTQGAPTFNVDDGGFYYLDAGYNSHYQQITKEEQLTQYAIATANYIVFNNGGLGLILEMFPAA